MTRYLLASRSRTAAPVPDVLESRVLAAWTTSVGAGEPRHLIDDDEVAFWATLPDASRWAVSDGCFCLLTTPAVHGYRPARRLEAAELLIALRDSGPDLVRDLIAPFSFVARLERSGPILVAADFHGLQHVYRARTRRSGGPGVALSSNACGLLGTLSGSDLDANAWLTFFRLGHFLSTDTPFEEVHKLPPARAWWFRSGEIDEIEITAPVLDLPVNDDQVRDCVSLHQELEPDAGLELSGGLDSRVILASLSPEARRGRFAVTLGTPDAPDTRIAERLVRHCGFDWTFVDLAGMDALDPAASLELVRRASRRSDHLSHPCARGMLDWVNAGLPGTPRFSGQNGELARGFYYPGLTDGGPFDRRTVESLFHWRLATNESLAPELIPESIRRDHETQLIDRLHSLLVGPRLIASDDYYLGERMHRWVGAGYSAESSSRSILAPFFDPRFIAWARALPTRERRGNLAVARLICHLDAGLARIPLASGPSPARLASPGPLPWLEARARFAGKVLRKVTQRLTGSSRPPVGAPHLAGKLLELGLGSADRFPHLARLDWIALDRWEEIASRGAGSAWASLGYLCALEWTIEDTLTGDA